MPKTIPIKCPFCKTVVNYVHQPDSWPKDKVSRHNTTCSNCRKRFAYDIVGGRCHSRPM